MSRPSAPFVVPLEGWLPVGDVPGPPVSLDDPDGGRWELANAVQNGVGRRDYRVERHVVLQCDAVDGRVDAAGGEQCWQRGREPYPVATWGEGEGLDAEPIPSQHQPSGLVLDDGEGEHAVEVRHTVGAPLGVGLADDLGIRGGEEGAAPLRS